MKKTVIALILIAITLVFITGAAIFLAPWKTLIAERIAQQLESHGLKNVSLSLVGLSLREARVENLQFGDREAPLMIPEIRVGYDIQDLRQGRVQTLDINGVAVIIVGGEQGWSVQGFPKKQDDTATPLIPPATSEYKADIPAENISLRNGALSVSAPSWTLSLPISGHWQSEGKPDIALQPAQLNFEGSGVKVSGLLEASASLNEEKKQWEGAWSLKSMTAHQKGAQEDMAPANIEGTLTADEKNMIVSGKISGEGNAYEGAFKMTYPFARPEKASLVLTDFSMPWQEGRMTTKNVNIPLSGGKPYTLELKISKASIAKLMQEFTGQYVQATGTISGSFPIKIGQDGKISVGKGTLSADSPGQISMPPETIPGEGAQMQITRDILQQFDYKLLSLTTEQADRGGLAMNVRIEGNNPKVEAGRPVILNIRLTGDILDFITNSAIVFTSPQTLIQQGEK